jgi:hypothetical protein
MHNARIRIILRSPGLLDDTRGPYELYRTFRILPSAPKLQAGAILSIPAHVQRLLEAHALAEAILVPRGPPGPFDYTLARVLGLDRHCLPLPSALFSRKYREMTYRLSITNRKLLSEIFFQDLNTLVKGNRKESQCLHEQYRIAGFITTLQSSICYLPTELLADIFLISVEELGMNPTTLQRVSRTWGTLVARLWGALQVRTWTEVQKVAGVVNQGPRSLDVVIDTAIDEDLGGTSGKRYSALELAWASASRWRSLAINSFPSKASIHASNASIFHLIGVQFTNLEAISIGPGCESSDAVNEIMEAIVLTTTPKLVSLTVATTTLFQRLDLSRWVRIYSQLTVLEVAVVSATEPVDLLRHLACVELLKLSDVISHLLLPEDELPLLRTLRQLCLQRASIRWIVGRTFERLESCTLLRPVDSHAIPHGSTIDFPICTSIMLQSHSLSILAAFHAPMADGIKIECNEWSKSRVNRELGRVWSRSCDRVVLRPKVLSLKMLCGELPLLDAIPHMVALEELHLDLPHPGALGTRFFEVMCAVPMSTFTGRTSGEWISWAHCGTTWQAKLCPSLSKLTIQYARWLRRGEMDIITPFLIAVAWSRENLLLPLQELNLTRGEHRPLQLVGMAKRDPRLKHLWQCRSGHHLSNTPEEALYTSTLTTVINRFIGFVSGKSEFPFKLVGGQYYGSFFRCITVFHHRPRLPPARSYDILPLFEHLEELDVSNFHFEPCPSTTSLPLLRTLRILHAHNTPLAWMDGRIFEQVVECKISISADGHISKLSRVEMPVCLKMEFAGPRYFGILASFHLPNLDSLLLELARKEGSHGVLESVRDVALLVQSLSPQVLQIRAEHKDENLVVTLQSILGGDMLIEHVHGRTMDSFEAEREEVEDKGLVELLDD